MVQIITNKSIGNYDPRRARINDSMIKSFVKASLSPKLLSVPGIGPVNEAILNKNGIMTSHELVWKFMSLVDTELFYIWLQSIGINSHRASIVKSVAEKMKIW